MVVINSADTVRHVADNANYKLLFMSEELKKILKYAGFVLVAFIVVSGSWFSVPPGKKAIVIRLSSVNRVVGEGIHWKIPFIEGTKKIEVRTQKTEVDAAAASKDLQNVTTRIAVNYQLEGDKVGLLFQEIGLDYDAKIIAPALQEAVKSATSKYTAEELITKRELVKADIKNSLFERLTQKYIQVTEVNIINFEFSKSFDVAIEAKVTAEQDALASKNKLEQVKYESEQRIAQARGEAEAIRIQAQAIQNQGGAEYVKLKWIEKWNGALPTTQLGNATPLININQ